MIVAGYTEPMNHFFASNPGLKSRFNTFIEFPDYSQGELYEMLLKICKENDYALCDEVANSLLGYLDEQVSAKDKNFANGRLVRNTYERLVMNHARRVSKLSNPSCDDLSIIMEADFIV